MSATGPTVTAAALAKLCPLVATSGTVTMYTRCKASAVTQDNTAVFDPINQWLAAYRAAARAPLLPGTVYSSDGIEGVAKNDDCSFTIEPFLGLFSDSYRQGAVVKFVSFNGLDSDEIDLDKDGHVIYLHAGDWAATATEVNFPGVTGGTTLESIYGAANKFLMCKLN